MAYYCYCCSVRVTLLFLFCLFLCVHQHSCMLEWLFGDGKAETIDLTVESDNIRFEILSSDEKFLEFAKTLNDLSPLDACYNIVIYNLKKKCGELSEEELGKLSVQLLNCQSEVEDRPVFPCTNSMSLADCTKSMDAVTWNSYQIVGNRARAMCYASQQVQFRKLTEATINKLASVTSEQIKTLSDLKTGQEQLHSLTSETVRKLYESQQDLLSTQLSLREAHEGIFNHIALNVKEIIQEKALIASGNQELAAMTENIRKKLDLTAEQIKEREAVEHKKHERILQDLKEIQDSTEASVDKLESSLLSLLKKFEQLDSQYSGMSLSLKKMNTTMSDLMSALDSLGHNLNERINWISKLLDGTDDKLSAMSCCLLHIAYFFLVASVATFLQISIPVRLVMLVIIVGNVAAELNYNHSFDFAGLTVFLFTAYFGFKLVCFMGHKFKIPRGTYMPSSVLQALSNHPEPLSSHEVKTLLNLLQRFSNTVSDYQNSGDTPVANGTVIHDTIHRSETPPSDFSRFNSRPEPSSPHPASILENTPMTRRNFIDRLQGHSSRSSSRSATPVPSNSRASTPGGMRCQAITVTGAQCRMSVLPGADLCRVHMGSCYNNWNN